MRDLISHPGVLLYDHLRQVGTRAASILSRLQPHLQLAIPPDELARVAFITGICHDFGKAKRQFQDCIWGGKRKDQEHAAISSVFAFVVAADIFESKPQPTRLLPFVCVYAINRHHGRLCNLEEAFDEAEIEDQIALARGNLDERVWAFHFAHEQLGTTGFNYREAQHRAT
ncbi:MAG: CRISPR-associated endonuclease Cas3'' [Candidatus Fervidibacter sp.]|uniref:CRISPR-associated endonuclease Cas3'' n=1 Tax=Candidatus Fervidibacter sp. TaxID=3100871 RepID=UPI004049CBE8